MISLNLANAVPALLQTGLRKESKAIFCTEKCIMIYYIRHFEMHAPICKDLKGGNDGFQRGKSEKLCQEGYRMMRITNDGVLPPRRNSDATKAQRDRWGRPKAQKPLF